MPSNLMLKGLGGIGKSKQVSLTIPAFNTRTQIPFGDESDLRYARILGIETFTRTELATSTPNNISVITDAQLPLINLTLETNDADDFQLDVKGEQNPNNTGRFRTTSQNIKWQPLITFHRIQNANTAPFVRELFEFTNIFITWDKSFITMPVPINPGATPVDVVLMVYYTFRNINGGLITRT